MTAYPPGLSAHLDREVTTVCHCWRLTRRDGAVSGYTDHDRSLVADGTVCLPDTGFAASEAKQSLGLAIDAADVEAALSSPGLSAEDIAAGLYDDATVETFLVNWRSPADAVLLRTAVIGRMTARDGVFVAELKSPLQALDQISGRYASRHCDAMVGDTRCGFDFGQPGFSGTGSVVTAAGDGVLQVSGLDGFATGWFAGGTLSWSSGVRAGRTDMLVAHQKRDGAVFLTLRTFEGPPPEAGNVFTAFAGCDKSFATCRTKFSNAPNFRGFPHLPGNDAAYAYAVDGDVFDGAPLVT